MKKEEKRQYVSPIAERSSLSVPLSFLESYSGGVSLDQYEDGDELGLDNNGGLGIGQAGDGGEL